MVERGQLGRGRSPVRRGLIALVGVRGSRGTSDVGFGLRNVRVETCLRTWFLCGMKHLFTYVPQAFRRFGAGPLEGSTSDP